MSYETYEKIRNSLGYKNADVIRGTGITQSTFSEWKKGTYTPKEDKRRKIAEFLGVSLEYLDTGIDSEKESTTGQKYYFDDATAQKAQELFENKELRMLFDAAQGASPEDLEMAAAMLRRFKKTNPELTESDEY